MPLSMRPRASRTEAAWEGTVMTARRRILSSRCSWMAALLMPPYSRCTSCCVEQEEGAVLDVCVALGSTCVRLHGTRVRVTASYLEREVFKAVFDAAVR
eukprot:3871570-Rhodomonas_salina.1